MSSRRNAVKIVLKPGQKVLVKARRRRCSS